MPTSTAVLTSIIRVVIRYRLLVLSVVAAFLLASGYSLRNAALDAIPDISDPQVIIYAKWPRSAELLDAEVADPLIQSLIGSPGIESIRATSHLGYSFVYLILSDPGQRAAVKQLALDRINALRSRLPADVELTLGPDASSLGWIYQYALIDREVTHDLRELRQLNESRIKPTVENVAGIAEVATVGGLERQIELRVFPPLLAEAGLSLRPLITAVEGAFQQVGGRMVELANRDYQLRGVIASEQLDDLEGIVIGRAPDGRAVRLRDIGYLQSTWDLRRGITDLDGEGEAVGGIVIMEQGENVVAVSRALDRTLDSSAARCRRMSKS